jgi:hypothetical protein
MQRFKTEKYTFFSKEVKKLEFHIPLIEKSIRSGQHPCAALGNYGFTFIEDIERLKEYLRATKREKLALKL